MLFGNRMKWPQSGICNAQTNPTGVRCDLYDNQANLLGRDPKTGFARRPLDSVGLDIYIVCGATQIRDSTRSGYPYRDRLATRWISPCYHLRLKPNQQLRFTTKINPALPAVPRLATAPSCGRRMSRSASHKENEMRTLIKVTVPVEAGNRAIREGSMQKTLAEANERLRPEAAYFLADKGIRTALRRRG
jgi:hypothetical protein